MNHLQAGVELAFTVLPKSSTLFEPSEGSFDHPSLRHDGEGVQVASFGDLDACPELVAHCVGERFAGVTAIGQHTGDVLEAVGATIECGQCAVAVRYLSRCDGLLAN